MFPLLKGKVQTMQNIVSEHEQYLDSLRDFNDWLISAKEELQRWSDLSGDSGSIKRKLQKVQVRTQKPFLFFIEKDFQMHTNRCKLMKSSSLVLQSLFQSFI